MSNPEVVPVCPSCHKPITPGARFCGSCGAAITVQLICPSCGAKLTEADRFCTVCGTPVAQTIPPSATQAEPAPTPTSARVAPPPQASYASAPAQPTRHKSALPYVIIAAVVVVLCMAGVVIGGISLLNRLRGIGGDVLSGDNNQPASKPTASYTGAGSIGFDGGTVSLPDGPEIEIPSGAITSDTGFGAKKVTIKISKSKQKADLPGDLPTVGDIYELQPEGLTFSVPVKITLPIPKNQDPEEILGLATKDPVSGEWVIVGSTVDAKARAVIGYSTHFSPWGIVGGRSEAAKTGGWVKVVNDYNRGSIDFPGCSYKPMTLENGVCFKSYAPKDRTQLVRPALNMIIAHEHAPIEYWLPAGTYTLVDFKAASEINIDPLYSPCLKIWARPIRTIVILPGTTIVFGENNTFPPGSDYVEAPNSCANVQSPASNVTPATTPEKTPHEPETEVEIFSNTNVGGVDNGATEPTTFTIEEPWLITEIKDYHWNDASGTAPGEISLQAEDGTTYGPWQATGAPGQGGVSDAYWIVKPNVVVPAGTYTIVDSDPDTWSQNSGTGGAGMSWVKGARQAQP